MSIFHEHARNEWMSVLVFELLRFVPPRDIPDMVLIFDKDGSVAGMQSGMPMTEFAMASPCSDSKYYLKDTINGVDVSQ